MKVINDFSQGKMDKEISGRYIPKGIYRDLLNGRVSSSDTSNIAVIESIIGNTAIPVVPLLSDDYKIIGIKSHENKIYYIATDNIRTTIGEYDKKTNTHSYIFYESLLFDLNKDYPIVSIDILGDMLFFCDNNYSEPYKINIKTARSVFNLLSNNPLILSKEAQVVSVEIESNFAPYFKCDYDDISNIRINKIQGYDDRYMLIFNIPENTLAYSTPRYIEIYNKVGSIILSITQETTSNYFRFTDSGIMNVDYNGYNVNGNTNEHTVFIDSSTIPTFTSTGVTNVSISNAVTPPGGLNRIALRFTVPKNNGNASLEHRITMTIHDGTTRDYVIKQSAYSATFRFVNDISDFTVSKNSDVLIVGCFTNQDLTVISHSDGISSVSISDQYDYHNIIGNKGISIDIKENTSIYNKHHIVIVEATQTGDRYDINITQVGTQFRDPNDDDFNTKTTDFDIIY